MKCNFPELLHAVSVKNKYLAYKTNHIEINENLELAHEKANSFLVDIPTEYIQVANQILNNEYQRIKRVSKRIKQYIAVSDVTNNAYIYFVTLTFNDKVLEKTKENIRRKYVQKFLNSICLSYVANIDFGKKNEREHYHAVIIANEKLNYKLMKKLWLDTLNDKNDNKLKFEIVKKNNTSSIKLSKYINKLSNHAMKDTTTQYCLYSRDSEKKLSNYVKAMKGEYVPFDYKNAIIIENDEDLPF